jgi:hypothetical protein
MRVTWPDYLTTEIVRELCIHKIRAKVLKPAGTTGKGKIQVEYGRSDGLNEMEAIIRNMIKRNHYLKLKETMYSIEGRTIYFDHGEAKLYNEDYPPEE